MTRLLRPFFFLLLMLMGVGSTWAETVDIPTAMGEYIATTQAVTTGKINKNDKGGFGSISNDATATFTLNNATEQDLFLSFMTGTKNNGSTITVDVTAGGYQYSKTVNVANTGSWIFSQGTTHLLDLGTIPAGECTLKFTFNSTASYVCNLGNIAIHGSTQYTQEPDHYIDLSQGTYNRARAIDKADAEGGKKVGYIDNGASCSYNFYMTEQAYYNLCMAMHYNSGGTMNVKITDATTGAEEVNQDITITQDLAKDYGNEVPMAITAPLSKGLKNMTLTFTSTGYVIDFENLRLTKRADYTPDATLTLKSASLDGVNLPDEALAALKEDKGSYTLTGNTYTATPVLTAWMSDNAQASVTTRLDGTNAVYTLKANNYEATLTVEGVHIYQASTNDKTIQLKYTSDGKQGEGNWSNGLYSLLSSKLDGWNNSSFKFNATEYTVKVPSNIKVKQITFKDLSNNYDGAASVASVTSEGATAISLPTKREAIKGQQYDLCVNIEGHVTGKDIVFNLVKAGQPTAWIELTVEETSEGNPTAVSTKTTVVNNHAVITVNFDRKVKDATATCNDKNITAEGGKTALQFAIWDLDYNHDYTFTIPAANITDNYGNTAKADVEVKFTTASAPVVEQATYDYVVSNADELDAAIAALKESNNTADAPRKTIFLKNGTYTYGTLTGSYQHNVSLKIDNRHSIYNVSLIGESKDGVLIEGTTDGITSSTLDLGDGTGNYLQDLTIRNNYDFRAETLKGVSVAVTGGNKTVLKNVAMQASQDTYVTGKRTYLEDCDIYGTTDFICGGGDIYFGHCNLILGNKTGNVISAPNTNADTHWGYVFQHCTVKADKGADLVTDGNWNLGRPWQNEPRTYYLYTTLEVLPDAKGWAKMGNLTTHFYEYKSYDKNGNLIDLSTRENSPSSTNHYTPVLTDEEAAQFTLRNVLGGSDSWEVIDETQQCAAPAHVTQKGSTLSWDAVEGARCYVIFKDGAYVDNTTATSYYFETPGSYSVCAANQNGGLGAKAYPHNITTNAAGWASFCTNENTVLEGDAQAYICTEVGTTTVTLEKITNIPAGQGVFVKGIPNTTYQAHSTATADEIVTNWIKGCLTDTQLSGTEGAYIIGTQNGKAGFFLVNSAITIPAGKAYLQPITQDNAKELSIVIQGSTTGIEIIEQEASADKVYYNLAGQRMKGDHGLVIVKGKKFIK